MKKLIALFGILVLSLAMNVSAAPDSLTLSGGKDGGRIKSVEARLSRSAVEALASNHIGLQQGALRMIIQYGDSINFRSAMFEVVHIYRDNDDQKMRQMAVVALGKMNGGMAVDYLRRAVQFEQNECVRRTMLAVITQN